MQHSTYDVMIPSLSLGGEARLFEGKLLPLSCICVSLVPRPRPAFRRFQYGKAGEGLVSFLT